MSEEASPPRGALAALVAQLNRTAPPPDAMADTLGYLRTTWARLSADRRLTQSLAKVPENAGPLNSQHLVHRSLTLMRELSPEYLHHFMAHVDALLWLDQAQDGGPVALGAEVARGAESGKKTARRQRPAAR